MGSEGGARLEDDSDERLENVVSVERPGMEDTAGPRPYPAPYRAARLAGSELGKLELGVACLAGLLAVTW